MLTYRKRRFLFWGSVLFFAAILLPVFLFSFGYGIGPGFTIQRTGGIAISANVSNAIVSTDFIRTKKISTLTKNALIKNLVPDEYKVSVKKDGYWEWEKTLNVESEKVTERSALLVPLEITGTVLGTTPPAQKKISELPPSVKKFWELPSGELLMLGEDGIFYRNNRPEEKFASSTLKILAEAPNSFIGSSGNEIVYWGNYYIKLLWYGSLEYMPQWQRTAMYDSYASFSPILDVREYPKKPSYLIVAMENGIFALEKEWPENNLFPLYKGKNPKIISLEPSSLILLDDGRYIQIELP